MSEIPRQRGGERLSRMLGSVSHGFKESGEIDTQPLIRRAAPPVIIVLTALVGLAMASVGGGSLSLVGGVILVAAAGTLTCYRLRHDALDAVGLYGLVSVAFFGLTSLLWLGSPPIPAPGIGRADLAPALILVASALAVFGVAARLTGRAHPVRLPPISASAAPSPAVLIALFALTVVVTAVGLRVGAIGYASDLEAESRPVLAVSQLLLQGSGIGGLVVLATALTAFATNSARLRRVMLILVPIQVVVGFVVGFKGASLIPIVYVLLAYIAVRGRIPWRTIGIVSLIAVLVLVPANLVYRYALRAPVGAAALTPGSTVETTQAIAGSRFRLIDHVALIHERTPSMYPFASGSNYTLLPALILVPRAVWPDKPTIAYGEEFSHTYWEVPRVLRTATPITQIGDLYRNFRTGGALLGIAIWGLVIGGFTALRRRAPSFRMEMVYLASLVTWITLVEADLPQLIGGMSRTLPVTVAVAWLLMPGRTRPPGYRRIHAALVRRSGFLARAFQSRPSRSNEAPLA